MSFLWISLMVFCAVLLAAILLITILLFSPVVFTVEASNIDSHNRAIRVRWLSIFEFLLPLPGGVGRASFFVAGRPVRPQPGEKAKEPKIKKPAAWKRPPSGAGIRLLWRCLRNSRIRSVVARQIARLGKRILHSFALTRIESRVSLSDPASNGMVAGTLALSRLGRALGVRVNFLGENSLFCEIRLYPYRLAMAFLFFAFGLPYRAILREWRTAAR